MFALTENHKIKKANSDKDIFNRLVLKLTYDVYKNSSVTFSPAKFKECYFISFSIWWGKSDRFPKLANNGESQGYNDTHGGLMTEINKHTDQKRLLDRQ